MATHWFEPSSYHITLGPHEPVLRIADGDTVVTTTVDAGGCDAKGEQVVSGSNPQVGPFSIEGTEPGDTLEVHLDKLRPNRRFGYSRIMVAPNVVDADYVPELPWPAEGESDRSHWDVDVDAWAATLLKPETSLGRFQIPLDPMLGCFGVAPHTSQAISTTTSERHGGNMDYRGFVEGVTAYFPVFEPGGLLFVGDGHAVQGDGEIVGSGIEISFDVEFTVKIHKGRRSDWPRGENDEFIFTVGNARPLDQALQHATSEMVRWLQQDYGLDGVSSNILMSQCVRYDLGNVYDPAYTMVCKMPKQVLPGSSINEK
jgi:amidase